MKSNRQLGIELAIKQLALNNRYNLVGYPDFYGGSITIAKFDADIRAECEKIIALTRLTDKQYDALYC